MKHNPGHIKFKFRIPTEKDEVETLEQQQKYIERALTEGNLSIDYPKSKFKNPVDIKRDKINKQRAKYISAYLETIERLLKDHQHHSQKDLWDRLMFIVAQAQDTRYCLYDLYRLFDSRIYRLAELIVRYY